MIRVVYRWKVDKENREAFREAWEGVTTRIRRETEGARGRVFLESCQDAEEVITIAHWDKYEQWQAFIDNAPAEQMRKMHELANLVSKQAFRQTGDHTI